VKRIASHGTLNAPWGMAWAEHDFGFVKEDDMLVGNFGDGRINVFSPSGTFKGQLKKSNGKALSIDGLWGIAFGNGKAGAREDRLYFTAGINDEEDGLFGSIKVVSTSQSATASSVSSLFSSDRVSGDLAAVIG
jgi:uncharacterized protein (TIGR03118 family)